MSDEPRRSGFTKVEFLVIIFINVILIALLYPAVKQAQHPDGPLGKLIPETAPDEKRRVTHASGISFIPPPHWVRIRDLGPKNPWLRVTPRSKGRTKAGLMIGKVGDYNQDDRMPDERELQNYIKINFQGMPAYERLINTRDEALDYPYITVYDLYFKQDGEWWHVSYWVSGTLNKMPKMMREYINEIRIAPDKVEDPELLENSPQQ